MQAEAFDRLNERLIRRAGIPLPIPAMRRPGPCGSSIPASPLLGRWTSMSTTSWLEETSGYRHSGRSWTLCAIGGYGSTIYRDG